MQRTEGHRELRVLRSWAKKLSDTVDVMQATGHKSLNFSKLTRKRVNEKYLAGRIWTFGEGKVLAPALSSVKLLLALSSC